MEVWRHTHTHTQTRAESHDGDPLVLFPIAPPLTSLFHSLSLFLFVLFSLRRVWSRRARRFDRCEWVCVGLLKWNLTTKVPIPHSLLPPSDNRCESANKHSRFLTVRTIIVRLLYPVAIRSYARIQSLIL